MTEKSILPFYLIDILYSYVHGSLKIVLIGRNNETFQRIYIFITSFNPYLYISKYNTNNESVLEIIKQDDTIASWADFSLISEESKHDYFRFREQIVYKLIGNQPFKVPEIKELVAKQHIDCFEYDIPFIHRYLIDSGLFCGCVYAVPFHKQENSQSNTNIIEIDSTTSQLKSSMVPTQETPFLIAAIDIETGNDESISFQELESKKEFKIIAISVCHGYYTESTNLQFQVTSFILSKDQDEKKLLTDFLSFIRSLDPDCIITFNGDNFDLPYIEYRLKLYDLEFNIGYANQKLQQSKIDGKYRLSGKAVVDLYPKTWYIHTKTGKKRLIDIAEYFFATEEEKILKLDIPELPGSLFNKGNIFLLQQYVEQDVKITFELFHKLLAGEMALVKINGAPYSDVLLQTQRVNGEFLLMRILYENNIIIPPKPKRRDIQAHKQKRKEHPHSGGQVITPKVSTAENVIIADFVSMYPTLMSSENIGSETFLSDSQFSSEPRSTLALLQERVISKRLKVKKQLKDASYSSENEKYSLQNQQKALKSVANSMYGATLYVSGRFFDIEVCNSITSMARSLMNNIFGLAQNFGKENGMDIEVIYSDTDSVFIRIQSNNLMFDTDNKRLEWLKHYQEMLLNHINANVPKGMDLVLEDIAKRILFQKMAEKEGELRKKAYAYYSLLSKKLSIKGFEAIRSDLSFITKKTQEKLFYILLNENNPEQKAIAYLRKTVKYIQSEKNEDLLLEKVLFSGIIRRSPSNYKSITPAIGAFLDYCKFYNFDPESYYTEFSRFPYAITVGKKNDPLFKRAKHPNIIKKDKKLKIDRHFYIQEIVRIAERFELKNPENKQSSLFDFI